MKNIVILILVVVLSIILLHQKGFAQSRYVLDYTYDAAGNRENKNLRVNLIENDWQSQDTGNASNIPAEHDSNVERKNAAEEVKTNVYPNPTVNELNIDFISTGLLIQNQQYEIALYDAKYTKCLMKKSSFGKEKVDVSALAAGNYMLIINANGKQYKYQIQKLN